MKAAGRTIRLTFAALLAVTSTGCAGQEMPNTEAASAPKIQPTATTTSLWFGLHLQTPHPYTTPLPDADWSQIDGTYAKVDPNPPQWWACRRCADYRPAGGAWKLSFDRGIMRIFYEIPLWRSLASFEITPDRLILFNDVTCPEDVGEYSWALVNRSLVLDVIEDPCSFGLRAENLMQQAWLSCIPPNEMVAASDHWHKPPGCESDPPPEEMVLSHDGSLTVEVFGAVAYDLAVPPEVIVAANLSTKPVPKGISVAASAESIPHGRNVVLWKAGDWVEVATELPFESIGVQIHGDHTIGWASVTFDGVEVWRGDTSELWSHRGKHGGYIQVSEFEPGLHSIRVETLAVDHRPVTVEFFGFGRAEADR